MTKSRSEITEEDWKSLERAARDSWQQQEAAEQISNQEASGARPQSAEDDEIRL